MRRRLTARGGLVPILGAAVALAGGRVSDLGAQDVGHPPAGSPFYDLEWRQGVSAYTGWFSAAKDPAGVAPRGGPLVGVRYDVNLGGPAWFTARTATVLSERTVLDPARPAARRVLGDERRLLSLTDVGITVALTGQKSFRSLVPLVNVGAGLATNFRGPDVGGYRFGTVFALTSGAGVRWVPGGRWSLRADLGTHLFQIRYPDRYFSPGLDSTSVLPPGGSKSRWTSNPSVTLGATYQFFR